MIRFICVPNALALSCMEAFAEADIPVRVLPHGALHFGEHPEWQKFETSFVAPLVDCYINVVCVEKREDFVKLCTKGMVNLAMTERDLDLESVYEATANAPSLLIHQLGFLRRRGDR